MYEKYTRDTYLHQKQQLHQQQLTASKLSLCWALCMEFPILKQHILNSSKQNKDKNKYNWFTLTTVWLCFCLRCGCPRYQLFVFMLRWRPRYCFFFSFFGVVVFKGSWLPFVCAYVYLVVVLATKCCGYVYVVGVLTIVMLMHMLVLMFLSSWKKHMLSLKHAIKVSLYQRLCYVIFRLLR